MDILREFLEPLNICIDVGCGSGDLSLLLAKEARLLVGIDPGVKIEDQNKPLLVKMAQKKSILLGVQNASFIKADGACLPIRNEVADNVVSISVLEHVGEWDGCVNKKKAMNVILEMLRVCKRGGNCMINVPNRWYPIDVHNHLPLNYCPQIVKKRVISVLRKMKPNAYVPSVSLFSFSDFRNLPLREKHYLHSYGLGISQNIEKSLIFRIYTKLSKVPILERFICSDLVILLSPRRGEKRA